MIYNTKKTPESAVYSDKIDLKVTCSGQDRDFLFGPVIFKQEKKKKYNVRNIAYIEK